jgi:chloride channel protein, CIC family
MLDIHPSTSASEHLGDYTVSPRMLTITIFALGIGVISAFVALGLLQLIGLFTNVFFYQRLDFALVSPVGHHLGRFVVVVPIIGAVMIGLMARYGSERIRGHGIPEAIEAILLNGSRVEPKLALLKPISAALSIGSGGPFGAEGPIILTGGAFGSMAAQLFHLTSTERKTLLVAGAAGGMSATFASPIAAVLLAAELLLFEWKPRSLVPVALSSAAAAVMRTYLLGTGPLFPVPAHPAMVSPQGLCFCVLAGIVAGVVSAGLTRLVYCAEDSFQRLPIHWMWWPAIGGLVIGLGGLVFPEALGVGYETIGALLQGDVPGRIIIGVLVVKAAIWAIALGSGTSGGVLAPLLMIGGALGGVEARFFPYEGVGFWPLLSMGAILGGTMRVPFTGIIFALELTHDLNIFFPLFIAVMASYGFAVLVMKRSILTEKVSRRGFHLSREYSVDPLEILFVREVMRTEVVALPSQASLQDLAKVMQGGPARGQRLYPVMAADRTLAGVLTRKDLEHILAYTDAADDPHLTLAEFIQKEPVTAFPDEPLRVVVYRMAENSLTRLPVVERENPSTLLGIIALSDLLRARVRNLEEERRRERVLTLRFPFALSSRVSKPMSRPT